MNDSGHLAFDKAFDKELKSNFFVSPVFVGVADQDGVTVNSRNIFDSFHDRRRKRIANIGNDDPDRPCGLGPKRSGDFIHVLPGPPDNLEHAFSRGRSNDFRAAKCPGYSCSTNIQLPGKVTEIHSITVKNRDGLSA